MAKTEEIYIWQQIVGTWRKIKDVCKKISENIPKPVKRFVMGMSLLITSQTVFGASTDSQTAKSDLQVLPVITTANSYEDNSSPIAMVAHYETHDAGLGGKLPPAATCSGDGYFGLIQMNAQLRKTYYETLKECTKMSNEEFAQKYCLTEKCNDEQITYLKNGCADLVRCIGDRNASNMYAHQRAAKKYPYLSAVTQELFDCADFYASAVKQINARIAKDSVNFKFEQLHPAIQFASFRILALGQNKYARIIGDNIANYIKKNKGDIECITGTEINEQMKEGLLKDILKPRPGVIKIMSTLEKKPIEYWLSSAHLYNAVNGGSSDSSWFSQREKEIRSKELQAKIEGNTQITHEPVSLSTEEIRQRIEQLRSYQMQDFLAADTERKKLLLGQGQEQQPDVALSTKSKKQLEREKEIAELKKNPAYWQAVRQAYADRIRMKKG